MPGVPPELTERLIDVLLRSSDLDSDQAIRAVFIDDRLAQWRNMVPENTRNRTNRVIRLIALVCNRSNAQGNNALVVLLHVLAEYTPSGDALHGELKDLANTFETIPASDIATLVRLPTPADYDYHDFYHHILLPPHYIPRPDILATVRTALLESRAGLALTSAVKVNALHGMGGIGKTVIARALCDAPEVQAAFPDGILWTTLGSSATEAELRVKLREWLNCLGGVVSGEAPTLDELKAALAQTLENRACLLIVDDVWQRTHAEAFQVGGANCRLLLTTRDAEIPRALGAALRPVDVLPEAQAVTLLERWAEGRLDDTALDLKQHIVARLGCLPLALKLAGAQLRDEAPEEWLQAFAFDDLEAPRVESPHDSLVTTFAHSLARLSPQDRQRYVSLAIFREDEPMPATAIAKLWEAQGGLSRRKVIRLLKDLASRALLQITETPDALKVTLHDLLRDYIITELGKPGALEAHRTLLDTYRATKTGEGWHTAPNDGYLYTHLAYHLDAIGDYGTLRTLFVDDAWLHARVSVDDYSYDGYLADLTLGWARAQAASIQPTGEAQLLLADCVHYALIHTSINTLASNYEPELVARAIETGLWPPERGVSVARRVVDTEKRARMVIALLKTRCLPARLCADMQDLGLAETCVLADEEKRAEVLVTLAPYLTEDLLTEGLAIAHAITSEERRARTLVALISRLTGMAREQALAKELAAACALTDEARRVKILAILAPHLTGNLLTEGLAMACAIANERKQARLLKALAPQLVGDQLTKGLAATHAIADEGYRTWVLVALIPRLTGDLLLEGLTMARAVVSEGNRALALAALAPRLTGATRDQVLAEGLAAAHEIADETYRTEVLATMNLLHTGDLPAQELATTRTIANKKCQTDVLATPSLQLTDDQLSEGLMACSIADEGDRALILATLIPKLKGAIRDQTLAEGLTAARAIEDERYRAEVLAALAPYLTSNLLTAGLIVAHTIRQEKYQAKVLVALAPQLTGDLLEAELVAARAIADESYRAQVLAAFTSQSTSDLPKDESVEGHALESKEYQTEVLTALNPQLTSNQLSERLLAARSIENEGWRAEVLTILAMQLKGREREQVLEEGLAAACAIADEAYRANALAALAQQFTGAIQEQALTEGLAAARMVANEERRAMILTSLASQCTGAAWEQALTEGLAAAHMVADERKRIMILAKLASQCTGAAWEQASVDGLPAARPIKDDEERAKALAALILSTNVSELILVDVRRALLARLWDMRSHERNTLLRLLVNDDLAFLRALGISQEGYEQIAQSIIAICTQWEWL